MTSVDPVEITRQFLQDYCADADGLDELVNLIEGMVMVNARPILLGLKGIEALLSQPSQDKTILNLVLQDAHIKLENPSAERARAWLTWLAKHIRSELNSNLLPFQPIRAVLVRIVAPADERFPHDLLLYPTDDVQPEYWATVWVNNIFYSAFMKEWDGHTCPTCNTPTVEKITEQKDTGETSDSSHSAWVYDAMFAIYTCTSCHCGWTERTGSAHVGDVRYP